MRIAITLLLLCLMLVPSNLLAKKVSFDFKVNNTKFAIYPCNAGIRHTNSSIDDADSNNTSSEDDLIDYCYHYIFQILVDVLDYLLILIH